MCSSIEEHEQESILLLNTYIHLQAYTANSVAKDRYA